MLRGISEFFNRRFKRKTSSIVAVPVESLESRRLLAAIVVNSLTDLPTVSGDVISLRAAISTADAASSPTTITFDPTVFATTQTISLSNGAFQLSNATEPTTIIGPAAGVIVNANFLSGGFSIDKNVTAALSNITVTQGAGYGSIYEPQYPQGGGIANEGALTLTNVSITQSQALNGGGFFNDAGATATLGNVVIASNNDGGRTNYGGGIYNLGTISISNSTITSNGGGAGGGLDNAGTANLLDVTLSANDGEGAGIVNTGNAHLINVTLSGNTGGALINDGGTTTLRNSTVYGNIGNQGSVSAFDNPVEGGIEDPAGTVSIGNSVVAGNVVDYNFHGAAPNYTAVSDLSSGPGFQSFGNNLIGDADGVTRLLPSDLIGTTANPLDPKLGALTANGGTTQTLLPLTGSPLINAGSNALVPAGVTTDQRGLPRIAGSKVDIGAVEVQTQPVSFVVNTVSDNPTISGSLVSLRAAIAEANLTTTPVSITFDPTVFASNKTITLANGDLDLSGLTAPITIIGPSVGVSVDGSALSTVFKVDAGVTATLSNITITNGAGYLPPNQVETDGGGIYNAGTLSLSNITLTANSAVEGGAIYNAGGSITLAGGTLSGNTAHGDGGAIDNASGTIALNNLTIAGNYAELTGGGIINEDGTTNLTGVTVSENTVGIDQVTQGAGGGIIENGGAMTLTNDTIYGNTAYDGDLSSDFETPGRGAGIFLDGGTMSMVNTDVVANYSYEDAGIVSDDHLTIGNSIIENYRGATNADILGGVTSLGHNIVGDASESEGWVSSDLTGNPANYAEADLGTFADNGGPTETLLPLTGSPAIDGGSNALIPTGITTDQRGLPRIAGGTVDIGPVEVQPVVQNVTKFTGTPIGTAGSWSTGTSIAAAFDGNLNTYFDPPAGTTNDWVGLDLGSAKTVTQISYAPRASYEFRMQGGQFQVSSTADFSSDVHTIYTITQTPPQGVLTTVTIPGAGAYRYVRYTGGTQWVNIAEMQVAGPAVKLTGTPIGTAGSYSPGTTIAAAFDGSLTTYFDPPANGNLTDWVGLDLGSAKNITQMKYAARNGFAYRMVGAQIQVSSTADFSSDVHTILTITSPPPAGTLVTVSIAPVTYRYIRYVGGTQWVNISELEVDGG